MPFYLYTGNYSHAAMKAMVSKPQNRETAARKLIESAGGKLHHVFVAMGPKDVIAIAEFPDELDMASVSVILGAAGGVTNGSTTKLMTMADFEKVLKRAKKTMKAYTPPQG